MFLHYFRSTGLFATGLAPKNRICIMKIVFNKSIYVCMYENKYHRNIIVCIQISRTRNSKRNKN